MLLSLARNVSSLNSSQVDQLLSQLESLLAGPNISLDLGNTSVQIVSGLMDASPELLSNFSKRFNKQFIHSSGTTSNEFLCKSEFLLNTSFTNSLFFFQDHKDCRYSGAEAHCGEPAGDPPVLSSGSVHITNRWHQLSGHVLFHLQPQ